MIIIKIPEDKNMKKFFLAIIILVIPIFIYSQNIEVLKTKAVYDEEFNATATLQIKNSSGKTITNIEVTFDFKLPDSSPLDVLSGKAVTKSIRCNIPAYNIQELIFYLPAVRIDGKSCKLDSAYDYFVRYSDGSVKKF